MKISHSTIGVAAEFAVASELGRRNVYAQPTFGHQKRTDLLIFGKGNKLLRLEVKSKQVKDWPNCKGIYGENVMLVFVDFTGKGEFDRPDFYILTVQDWVDFAKKVIADHPQNRIVLDKHNVLVWKDQLNAKGQPYLGTGVKPEQIKEYKEQWDKIIQVTGQISDDE